MKQVPFELETDLCAVLSRHLGDLSPQQNASGKLRTFANRPVGTIIPDFIVIHSDNESLSDSYTPARAATALTPLEASIVAALTRRPLRDVTIARRLYSHVDRITPHLRSLQRMGIIEISQDRVCILRRKELAKGSHVIAVEAKLRRWREAIDQAAAYLGFANQAYVALPTVVIEGNRPLTTRAAACRVGVLAVGPDGVSVRRSAPHNQPQTADRVWLLSRAVSVPAD